MSLFRKFSSVLDLSEREAPSWVLTFATRRKGSVQRAEESGGLPAAASQKPYRFLDRQQLHLQSGCAKKVIYESH